MRFLFWPCRNSAVVWISQDSVATGLKTTKPSALELSFAPGVTRHINACDKQYSSVQLLSMLSALIHSYFTRISVFLLVTGKGPAKMVAHHTSSFDNFMWTLVLQCMHVRTYWCMCTTTYVFVCKWAETCPTKMYLNSAERIKPSWDIQMVTGRSFSFYHRPPKLKIRDKCHECDFIVLRWRCVIMVWIIKVYMRRQQICFK